MQRAFPVVNFALIAVLAGLLASAGDAGAVRPADQNSAYEIPLRQFDLAGYRSAEVDLDRGDAEAMVSRRYGGTWRVYTWNPQTGTPSQLYGSGVNLAPGLASAAEAEAAARQVIAENPDLFGAALHDLEHGTTAQAPGKWAVHFQQTYHGLEVWRGGAHLVFSDGGRLFVMGSTCYPGIALDPAPAVAAHEAAGIARNDLPYNARTDRIDEEPVLMVLPVALTVTAVEYHLVWRVRVHTSDPLGIWVTHVDAHDGEILWRYNDVHFLDFEGDAQGDIEPHTYCNGIESQPLRYMRVDVDGVGSTVTDQFGNWSVPYGGTDPHDVSAELTGTYIEVRNQSGPNALFTGFATPGVPFTIAFDDSSAQRDERDCFNAVNDIHDFISVFDPGFGYINERIICNVSLNAYCNAYWNGTINFYIEGGGCANTGQIQGVVHHEYGHGIQDHILGWQGDEGLGEGNADIMANLITQESVIGRGFHLGDCVNGIRNSDNNLVYPDDVIGHGIHYAGQVIAGFHWDFMVFMQAAYGTGMGTIMAGERWHFGRVLYLPTTQPDQVLATFMADDDDADLTNGTPHHEYLCAAAQNHGFECPEILVGVIIDHTPLEDTMVGGDIEIVATVYSTEAPLAADSLVVSYRLDEGPFVDLLMTPTGIPDQFRAEIPDVHHSTTVAYYIRAADLLDNSSTSPPGAPTVTHTFDVAWLLDPLEEPGGWVVNLEGTDTATAGFWVQADPVGTAAQPEHDHTPGEGRVCWVTGNGNPGDPVDYNDVDNGATTVYTPLFDLTGASSASVTYWRWYSNDILWNPNEDYWVVQARNNGGPWVDVENNQDDQNAWICVEADLISLLGGGLGEVQLKFIASDLINPSVVEAAVDDLKIMAAGALSAVPQRDAGGLRYAHYGARTNPVVGPTEIAFQLPYAGKVELQLFDVGGRSVRTLADRIFEGGIHTVAWDGRDSQGQPVASGVYYCRLTAGEYSFTRTLVVSR
jgi:hypothetical protein